MIKFEHNKGELKAAVFAGSLPDLCADLCVEISLIYGSLFRTNEKKGEEFRKMLFNCFVDREISEKLFSTELYDDISGSGDYVAERMELDEDEFMKQLKELLDL